MNSLAPFDKLSADVSLFLEPIKAVAVTDAASCATALETVKQVKALAKQVTQTRIGLVKPHNDFVDSVNEYAKRLTGPLADAEIKLKAVITAYEMEQERERQKERQHLEDERVAKELAAEKERLKVEAAARAAREAEEKRIAAELKAKADAERKEREEAEAMFGARNQEDIRAAEEAAERERVAAESAARERANRAELERLATNARLERERNERDKETKRQLAEIEAGRVKNMRKTWVHEITDGAAIPRQYLVVDESLIRAAIKGGAREIPGVRIYEKTDLAVSSRASVSQIA